MSALRKRHRSRRCFYGWREVRVVFRVDAQEFVVAMRRVVIAAEKVYRPARARQRFADTMAGNGHLWAKR
jgi:hypothetical protein